MVNSGTAFIEVLVAGHLETLTGDCREDALAMTER